MINEILQKYGLKFEDLNILEREQLTTWMSALEKNKLTLDGVRTYIQSMKDAVEHDLTKTGHDSKQDLFLKARLRNYMLLEAFLSSPDRAKKALETSLAGITSKK